MVRRILVTSALPYANGPIHLGHLVEYIQTDIWVRFQRLRGNQCKYFCADDTHGTAIMIRARQENTTEAAIIAKMAEAHRQDFAEFGISFDHYSSTHSDANREICTQIWAALRRERLIEARPVEQLYDPVAKTFLADRFVKGTCPKCGAVDQYGDNCDKCGATYSAADLKDAKSTLSGAAPELRSAEHLFVTIEQRHAFLESYTQSGDHLDSSMANYLKGHFLNEPLRDWDISRPAPYFGFEIPDAPGNYWYVWFDAPIGYIGSTREWCTATGEDFDSWWRSKDTEVHHFIGKDIVYFHALFWPAMLDVAGFTLPTKIHVHGFLTVDGEKMSKTKGTFVTGRSYLDHLDPAYLRYYYASKLGARPDDLDLNLEEFQQKVNSDLVGKVVNLASRTARFLEAKPMSTSYPDDGGLFAQGVAASDEIAEAYEQCDLARAMRLVMALADRANEYVGRVEPWKFKNNPNRADELRDICTVALNLFRQVLVYLAPVLPNMAEQAGALLGVPITHWSEAKQPLLGHTVGKFTHMMARIEPAKVRAMMEANLNAAAAEKPETAAEPTTQPDDDSALKAEPLAPQCSIEEFGKIDMRVARVVSAEHVPEAKKLLKLKLSLGGTETRQVFAGIKSAYAPEQLIGRLVVMVANLAPRQMKFGLSEGMIVCASGGDTPGIFCVSPDTGAKPGMRLR
ncbi:MAG TPA: methionine--tRNA ligase [Polyangiaceae bacterium]|nr:methionine--tRNA ligase [Polyangiaceae bacterium]